MIRRIQFRLGNPFFFQRHDEPDLDALILVSGCPRACAGQDLNQKEVLCYLVTREDDFEMLLRWLTTLNEKGDSQ